MKKLTSILFLFILVSCSKTEKTKTIKVDKLDVLSQKICDCFEEYNGDEDEIMRCFELQDEYWNSIEDSLDKIEFLNKTYKCIN